eukprot:8916207-Lingulodinium_polyedra.AAC.1
MLFATATSADRRGVGGARRGGDGHRLQLAGRGGAARGGRHGCGWLQGGGLAGEFSAGARADARAAR